MISIIVPMYNSSQYIKRCVDSILNNSFKDYELLLIDDGSNDDTLKIANNLAKKDARIKIIKQEHRGISYTRNNGLKKAKGEYIGFIDSDDYVDSNYLKDLYNKIESENLDWVHCGYCRHNLSGYNETHLFEFEKNYYNQEVQEIICSYIFDNYPYVQLFSPCMSLYKKKIIDDNKLSYIEDINHGEDIIFNYGYVKNIKSFGVVNKTMYHVVVRENSINYFWNKNLDIKKKIKFIDTFVKQIKKYNDKIEDKQNYFVNYFFLNFKRNIYKKPFFERIKIINEVKKEINKNDNCKWLLNQMNPFYKKLEFSTRITCFIIKYSLYHTGYIIWRAVHLFVPYE